MWTSSRKSRSSNLPFTMAVNNVTNIIFYSVAAFRICHLHQKNSALQISVADHCGYFSWFYGSMKAHTGVWENDLQLCHHCLLDVESESTPLQALCHM